MKLNLLTIINSLDALSSEDLKTLKAQVIMKLETKKLTGAGSTTEDLTNESLFYHAVADKLSADYGVKLGNYFIFRKSQPYKVFQEAQIQADQYIERSFKGVVTRTERVKLYGVMVSLVFQNIQNRGKPMVLPFIVHVLKDIPILMEQAFPGYATAGVLEKLLK